jgi:hypothetical protein
MTDTEFITFSADLSRVLGFPHQVNEAVKIFEKFRTGKFLDLVKFKEEFNNWSDLIVTQMEGVEVIEPRSNLAKITKNYEVRVVSEQISYKKFLIHNPEDYAKILKVTSSDSSVLIIRSPMIKVEPNSKEFIKFKVKANEDQEVFISVVHEISRIAEENISVKILVEERPVTPTQTVSGNLKKNKSWNFTPRRPSPKRNSIEG